MIELSKEFIPTTDEVWRLQGAQDRDAIMFQEMANKGHYRKVGGSRQGIYICSPSGALLSSVNSLNPDVVLEIVQKGLDAWNQLPVHERKLPEDFTKDIEHRWEDSYPEGGLILKGAKADLLSDPPKFSERGDRWNMDHVWFNKSEAKKWIPKNYIKGERAECPKIIKDRLFRFHLVDNVRGQTLPFAPQEIKKSNLQVEIVEINNLELKLNITGSSLAIAKGPWLLGENDWTPDHILDHSIETNVLGSAIYNIAEENFKDFELVIIGRWNGKTQNNGRKLGPNDGHIGIVYNIADDSYTNKIAPAFVDLYNADWITQPQ